MRRCLLALTLCFSVVVQAVQDNTDPYSAYRNQSDYDESQATPWVENETILNTLPKDDDLTELVMDNMPKNMSLDADLANLRVGDEDRVTRLWLVVRSQQGAYNGSYEGYRCATREYKIYAHANPKRQEPLRMVALPSWFDIRQGSYRDELMRDYLCRGTQPRTQDEVIQQLGKRPTDPTYDY